MNSDKMDQYFREQIQSLDRVKVPDASWAPDKSWDRIQPKKKRAAIFWWSGGSVAAALLLMLGYFWLMPQQNFQNSTASINDLSDQKTNKIESPIENLMAKENNLIDSRSAENIVADKIPVAAANEPSKRIHQDVSPLYLQLNISDGLLASDDLYTDAPTLRVPQIDEDQKPAENTAFNRVYVFKKGVVKNEPTDLNRPELAIRIDFTMKSTNDPPGGVLANFRK